MTNNKNNKQHITLIGMPGAGKSTLGVVAAKKLNMQFLDADLRIQEVYGSALPNIIESRGTEGFIEAESRVLQSINPKTPTIIATGGSAIYTEVAMEHLRNISKVIYLRVSFDELVRRLGPENLHSRGVVYRSLEDGANSANNEGNTSTTTPKADVGLKDVYDQRITLYEKYAHDTINVDGTEIIDALAMLTKSAVDIQSLAL